MGSNITALIRGAPLLAHPSEQSERLNLFVMCGLSDFIAENIRCETCGFSEVGLFDCICHCDEVFRSITLKAEKCECYLFSKEMRFKLDKFLQANT